MHGCQQPKHTGLDRQPGPGEHVAVDHARDSLGAARRLVGHGVHGLSGGLSDDEDPL